MKRILAFTTMIVVMVTLSWATAVRAGEDKVDMLLDILKQKGIVNEEEYKSIKKEIEEKGKNDLLAVFDKGFKLSTRDNKFELGIGGRFNFDFRGHNSGHPEKNQFDIRRIRAELFGKLYENFKFKTEWELEGSNAGNRLKDGYIEYDYFKDAVVPAVVRLGQFKEPFNMEELTSDNNTIFVERSLNNALAPSRDLGVMLYGNPFGEKLHYEVGVFNGHGVDANGEDNNDKDVALRLVMSPFITTDSIFKELHFGGAFTHGHEKDETVTARSEAYTKYFEFKSVNTHRRTRLGGELNWMVGPFTLNGEYIRAKYEDLEGKVDAPFALLYRSLLGGKGQVKMKDGADIDSWYITAAYCLTGEKRSYKNRVFSNITPKNNFDPRKGTWGAWEVAFRYARFDADDAFFNNGIVNPDYTRKADSFNFGINWFLNPNVLIKTNYVHTDFHDDLIRDGKKVDDEDVYLMRFQLIF